MRFEEFTPGLSLSAGRRRVTQQEIIEFAQRYDPQWFHTDPERACTSRWHGLIASGWMTCSIAMQLAVSAVLQGAETIGSPGVERIRWLAPLRPGDEVELHIQILERRVSRSRRMGIVRWQWTLTTHRGDAVLDVISTILFELQPNTVPS